MKILKVLRRKYYDFWADYKCEHCGHIESDQPGDDSVNFYNKLLPKMKCPKCGKTSDDCMAIIN